MKKTTNDNWLPRDHDGVCDHCGQDVGDCPCLMDRKWACIDCIHGRLEEYDKLVLKNKKLNAKIRKLK